MGTKDSSRMCPWVSIKLMFWNFFVPPARSCGMTIPTPLMGMDVAWPYKKRELGDTITYTCPSQTLTWEEHLEHQVATCIWHRQTDSMIWWPPELHSCNRKISPPLCPPLTRVLKKKIFSNYSFGPKSNRKIHFSSIFRPLLGPNDLLQILGFMKKLKYFAKLSF